MSKHVHKIIIEKRVTNYYTYYVRLHRHICAHLYAQRMGIRSIEILIRIDTQFSAFSKRSTATDLSFGGKQLVNAQTKASSTKLSAESFIFVGLAAIRAQVRQIHRIFCRYCRKAGQLPCANVHQNSSSPDYLRRLNFHVISLFNNES